MKHKSKKPHSRSFYLSILFSVLPLLTSCGDALDLRKLGESRNNYKNDEAQLLQSTLNVTDLIKSVGSTSWSASSGPALLKFTDQKYLNASPNSRGNLDFVIYFSATQSQLNDASSLKYTLVGQRNSSSGNPVCKYFAKPVGSTASWVEVGNGCFGTNSTSLTFAVTGDLSRIVNSYEEIELRVSVSGLVSKGLKFDAVTASFESGTTQPAPSPDPITTPTPTQTPTPTPSSEPAPPVAGMPQPTNGGVFRKVDWNPANPADYRSIQAALNASNPGDVVLVKPGTYSENIVFPKSGLPGARITVYGETGAVIDGTGKNSVGVQISNKSHVTFQGLRIQNFSGASTPMGIHIQGSASFVEIRNNVITNIVSSQDAHGILASGNSLTPMDGLVIEGNELFGLQLGSSEALVVNGNVTNWKIMTNKVYNSNNIAIDAIGHEGTCAGCGDLDSARNGLIKGNVIYNINSAGNPAYGNEKSAGGIYVDGGRNIVIEENKIDRCNIGIEVASEHKGLSTSNVIVRNNLVSRSDQTNILVGGYDALRGSAQSIQIYNNTTYGGLYGEIALQYYVTGIEIKNNILYARPGQAYVTQWGTGNSGVGVENNMYFGASTSTVGAFTDLKAKFQNPLLTRLTLDTNVGVDLHLTASSPARNLGMVFLDSNGSPLYGLTDVDGQPRLLGAGLDLGGDEVD